MTWVAGLLIAFILAAGCLGGPAGDTASTAATSVSSSQQPTPTSAPTNTSPLTRIPFNGTVSGNGCTGFSAVAPIPPGAGPSDEPAGWTPDRPSSGSVVDHVYTCTRLAMGNVERPASLLFDGRTNVSPPQNCTASFGVVVLVRNFWTDDPQVAAFLRDEMGAPVIEAKISESVMPLAGGLSTYRWTIEANGTTNTLSMNQSSNNLVKFDEAARLAWVQGTGISYLDWTERYSRTSTPGDTLAGSGRLNPPFLYSDFRPNPYFGLTIVMHELTLDGTLHRFKDLRCEQPY